MGYCLSKQLNSSLIVCHFVSYINVHVFGQRPGRSDGLSAARADFIGSLIRQLRPGSSQDSRPVNHPVAIEDGDTAFGLQSWGQIIPRSL